ncbi:MAG: hypothetical protein SGARI_001141 [Bacillariaceae sp.]
MLPLNDPVSQDKLQTGADADLPAMSKNKSFEAGRKRRKISSGTDNESTTAASSPKHHNFEISDRDSLTEQEMNAMFVTQEDQKRIFVEISETLAKAGKAVAKKRRRNGVATISELEAAGNEGIRGLECIVQKRNSTRGKRMKAAVNAVMKRQAAHDIDEAWIATAYRPLLVESKKLARERGLKDEVDGSCVTEMQQKQQRDALDVGKVSPATVSD